MTKLTIIAVVIIFASTLTAILYTIDKRAAATGRRRIPEKTLLIASVLGGWPGAWLIGRQIRHKTAKTSYRIQFALAVVIHVASVAAIVWLI